MIRLLNTLASALYYLSFDFVFECLGVSPLHVPHNALFFLMLRALHLRLKLTSSDHIDPSLFP
jgi:hypothetical protein